MSRLTFTGNEIKSTGEYLPAPYINKITVSEDALNIENFIFINDVLENYVISAGEIVNSQDIYGSEVLGLYYYVLVVSGFSEDEYQSIIDNDTNPFSFYYDKGFASLSDGLVRIANLVQIEVSTLNYETLTDQAGNIINTFSSQTEINTDASFGGLKFKYKPDYVFCFASSFDYFSNSTQLSSDTFNQRLFDLYVGDVSYERIYDSDGNLALGERVVFVDLEQNFYDEVPLQSIDYTVHKIDTIDHEYIKENIEELLSEYSDLYNSETGNTELKNVMNSIYTTLETSYQDYDILNKLEFIRRSFPNKTPSNNVGKLYKRFSQRMYNINNTVKQVEQVFKQIKYNSKLIDLQPIATGSLSPSFNGDLSDTKFIYTDWKAVNLDLGDGDKKYSTRFGYFFVDYEKALVRRSAASNFLDVRKLEKFGMPIPYSKFQLEEMKVLKSSTGGTLLLKFDSSEYPKTTLISYESDYTIEPDTTMRALLADTPYGANDSSDTTPANGYATHVINRKYTPIYDTKSEIEDYRLMLFEIMEYAIADTIETSGYYYFIDATFKDQTVDILVHLKSSAQNALVQIKDYYTEAQETCVFSTDLGKFNQFFVDGIIAKYQDEPQSAPWYVVPVVYVMQLDLYYNLYGGDSQEMEDAIKKLVNKINPVNGTLEEISAFIDEFEAFVENTYFTLFGNVPLWSLYSQNQYFKAGIESLAGDSVSFVNVPLSIPALTDIEGS